MKLFHTLRDDLRAVFERDPAARTRFEVILSYPGLHALWSHRAAHWLWAHRLKLAGRNWNIFSRATLGNTRAVVRYLARYTSPGDDIALTVLHDGEQRDVVLNLGQRPNR